MEQSMSEKLAPSMLQAAQSFSKAMEPLVDTLRQFVSALNEIGFFQPPDIQPSILYALHGHPYGKHTRGKKRWLREMKARHRQ